MTFTNDFFEINKFYNLKCRCCSNDVPHHDFFGIDTIVTKRLVKVVCFACGAVTEVGLKNDIKGIIAKGE